MAKVYLSPSDQYGNSYAVGSTNEGAQMDRVADALRDALLRCGFEVKRSENMYDGVREANAWGAELYIPLHSNACNGKVMGTRLFCYKMHDSAGKETAAYRACRCIFDRLAPITPGTSENIKENNLYETRTTHMPCAYIEVDFHDAPEAARWIITHTQDIAEAICRGVCDYFGVAYTPPASPVADKPAEDTVLSCRVVLPVLRRGDRGAAVKSLQRLLTNAGYACGSIDGDFGTKTYAAVLSVQQKNALDNEDGQVGAKTWARLLVGV